MKSQRGQATLSYQRKIRDQFLYAGLVSLVFAISIFVSPAIAQVEAAGSEKSSLNIDRGPKPELTNLVKDGEPSLPASGTAEILSRLPNVLTMYVGQITLVQTPDVARIAVGNGKVISARQMSRDMLMLIGQDAGDTTLHVWDRRGKLTKTRVRVNIGDQDRLIDELKALTNGITGVEIKRVGERFIIEGSNLDKGAVERLNQISKLYPQVVLMASAERIRVDRMVDIRVQIIEFSKSAIDELGVNWQPSSSGGFNFGIFSDIASSGDYRILNGAEGGLNYSPPYNARTPQAYFGIAASLSSRINALVQRGDALVLATPSLMTRSGGDAKFLAGGEIPLPALSTVGAGSVTFKPYGVVLNIKPIADTEGNIAANVSTEISSIDRGVTVSGIPGLLIRRTESEFNVKSGDTIVLSGLINREASRSGDGLPGLRNIPLLGWLFRSESNSLKQSEVVFLITPRVVQAADSQPIVEKFERRRDLAVEKAGFKSFDDDKKPDFSNRSDLDEVIKP